MFAYYNELDPFPCRVIETNIARGRLPSGRVDCRSIEVVATDELIRADYKQFHLFAGIGGAAYACRLAGLPDNFSIGTMGFPCQDISCAGAQQGIGGARSGLFFYGAAFFRVLRPRWLLLENVPNLRTAGAAKDPDGIAAIELVIAALEEINYCVLPPVVVGADDAEAPQKRRRVWIVARSNESLADTELQFGRLEQQQSVGSRKRARNKPGGRNGNVEYPTRSRTRQLSAGSRAEGQGTPNADGAGFRLADATGCNDAGRMSERSRIGQSSWPDRECRGDELADTQHDAGGAEFRTESGQRENKGSEQIAVSCGSGKLADADDAGRRTKFLTVSIPSQHNTLKRCGSEVRWPARPGEAQYDWEHPRTITGRAEIERALGSPIDGLPERLVRSSLRRFTSQRRNALKGYGNAWVPQCAVPILQWILEQDRS